MQQNIENASNAVCCKTALQNYEVLKYEVILFSTENSIKVWTFSVYTDVIQFKVLTALPIKSSRASRAKIENLKWQIGGDIIPLTFRKFVTLLVQQLKILGEKRLVVSTLTDNFCHCLIS